jgi:UDP-N-acetylmuramoyl-L-alanyl-D-glutamate--2,6-diaminopimelate ligase
MMARQQESRLTLSTLFMGIGEVDPADDRAILNITTDSREVAAGDCFLALLGTQHDGMKFAKDAAARGAVAIVAENRDWIAEFDIPVVTVPALRHQLGQIANRFFELPSAQVRVFAVTGTNGKTTVAHLAAQAMGSLDKGCGYIGTLGAGRPGALSPVLNTTPDVITLNRWLAQFRDEGISASTLEASSHGLDQGRIAGVRLHTAAFTNLGHDHLDYHGSLAAYADSKRQLFNCPQLKAAVINVDDALGAEIAHELRPGVALWTCSSARSAGAEAGRARVTADAIDTSLAGVSFEFRADQHACRISSRLIGRFNIDNLLVIGAILLSAGYDFEQVCTCLEGLEPVPGRMELCGVSACGARVFIDYAHSPESLAAALQALRDLKPRRQLVVFGCGGNRDVSKRPLMGAAAAEFADRIILTADNPRDEDAQTITKDILAGIDKAATTEVIVDREQAIRVAITTAAEGDIVLIAGKGHETMQELGNERRVFSDRDVALGILAEASL